jgi:hypothetical protein
MQLRASTRPSFGRAIEHSNALSILLTRADEAAFVALHFVAYWPIATLRERRLPHCKKLNSRNGPLWNIEPDHSGLMLAARITFPHLSISSAMNLPNCTGEFANG